MRRYITASLVGSALLALSAFTASAMPVLLDGPRASAAEQSPIMPAHGCHYGAEEGRYGWHYHRGRYCDRIASHPPRSYYRGPRCYTDCKYIGPIKVCKQRCD